MNIIIIPEADKQVGFSGHARMYGIPCQQSAEHRVIGIGRQTADDVGWINIFQRNGDLFGFKIGIDFCL